MLIFLVFFFIAIAALFSRDRKNIQWKSVGIVLALEILLAWFFTQFKAGQIAVQAAADGFNWLVSVATQGIAFALPEWLTSNNGGPNFVTSALLPILLVVPLFDILTYIGLLPWLIKWIGKGLAFITGQPKFEAFFSIEMMFLGNTEVLAVSKAQLDMMSARRNFTLAMMSMSCVTSAIIGSYTQMVPGKYVLTAIPLNILGAIIIATILNPTKVTPEEDVIVSVASDNGKKEPFFSFLGDSILGAGKLILIITATVIAFVSLAALINQLFSLTGLHWLTLENIFGVIMFPFAWLLGFNVHEAFQIAQYMGTKLVTNEFVVMGEVSKSIMAGKGLFANEHARIVLTVFLTSFANFGTLGMIIGCFKGLVSKEKNDYISARVPYMLLSGILVSLLSAATAGMFVW
ncbi:NupC/NupG family nucleoside CNT transporter [Leuconostoc mesenteroides]|nr:nucleoside transporter C-terminal domain-containing protein [Leuconostoc mesenteroides]MBZ1509301.1 NupC/NupG family nucleoside CNT transporter [Leuconostoc mesenteroides]MBZ1512262.1 NupC/NupG family nucleoside CNT transporter [Leuconostoc mesenteroides]MBZ1530025.1 NupC/NupG family nucleoside CNT transporter [Leuconostoc mesenteroides]MBZ1533672.1 NupC/NupG family nucleoside CNT transporter [Leuconostoc mesenteroides]